MKIRLGITFVVCALAGCGGGGYGGGSTTPVPARRFTIGGVVAGLESPVVIQNNLGDDLTVSADGLFTFATPVRAGAPYSVTVKTQPSMPSQVCRIGNGAGVANSNVVDVLVVCDEPAATSLDRGTEMSGAADFPSVDGPVYALAPDGAGGWYIGGLFDHAGGLERHNLAHILPDLSVDPGFAIGFTDGLVSSIAPADGVIHVGGTFSHVDGAERNHLAAVDARGALLPWNPDSGPLP